MEIGLGTAQQIADGWQAKRIHRKLDELAPRFSPIFRHLGVQYHGSIDQCEYAGDIVFHRQADLGAIYENLTRTTVHRVKADKLNKIWRKAEDAGRSYRGCNFLDEEDQNLFPSLARG